MPLNANIPLSVTTPNFGKSFRNALLNVGTIDTLNENRELAPFRKQQAIDEQAQRQAQTEGTNLANQSKGLTNISARDKIRVNNLANLGAQIKPFLDSNDQAGALGVARQYKARVQQSIDQGSGLDTTESDQLIQILESGDLATASQLANAAISMGQGLNPNKIQSSQFIPGRGFATLSKSGEVGFQPVEGVGETTEQKRKADLGKSIEVEKTKAKLQGRTSAIKAAVKKGGDAFDRLQPLSTQIANYDEAIKAIDEGAETGFIDSMLPSFRKASIELDNVKNRLGLDVVGNTTFGALSESELKFALSAALPDNLQPKELKEWLIAKRNAQRKVKERLEEAASFLSDGTHTIKDWIEFDKARQLNNQQETINTNDVIKFDQNGVVIQ